MLVFKIRMKRKMMWLTVLYEDENVVVLDLEGNGNGVIHNYRPKQTNFVNSIPSF